MWNDFLHLMKPGDTHVISMSCEIGENSYYTNFKFMSPSELRETVFICLKEFATMYRLNGGLLR